MPFQGRTVQGVEKNNAVGLNENPSILNVGPGVAIDMDNWEVDLSGAIQQRMGMELTYDFGYPCYYFGVYFSLDGAEVWVAVVNDTGAGLIKFYEATSPTGPWTNRMVTPLLTNAAGPWIGTELNGKFVLVNGTDAPIYHTPSANVQTLKNASLIIPPQNLLMVATGANDAATNRTYAVTAITARGETPISNTAGGPSNTTLDATHYNALSWDLRAGAQGYNVYKNNGTKLQLIASVGRLTNTYNDTSATFLTGGPPLSNTAYNTPLAWDEYPPSTLTVVARGRAQRMLATVGSQAYASALSDCLDWETGSDAFNFPVRGGTDNTIRVSTGLYDYTILMSDTNSFVYTGSTYNDFQQTKVLNVGCKSPHSLITAGDELYFWSDLGPNSFSRIQYGQDLQTDEPMHLPVQKTVHNISNKSAWSKIVAWKDVRNLRIAWAYPVGTDTANSKAIIRGTKEKGWSRHSMPAIINAATDEVRDIYVMTDIGKIFKLYTGDRDGGVGEAGVDITGYYTTGWYESQSNLTRYMDSLTVVMDKSIGNYSLTVEVFWDFATTASSTHTLTHATTDGVPVTDATPTANHHQLYVQGIGKWFQLKFSSSGSTTRPRVLGWREEMYAKGRR